MNPNFALDFRNDQIKLLHSQEGVWVQIGVVALDDPDLDAALGYMRSTALGLSPRGLAAKLILPDAAILYTTLDKLSPDANTRATQIALALVGRTPYQVSDLVYDWTDEGAKAHLAVIARETLDEAEAFANQHRFNPVAFAAWPDTGPFQGEADFGRSANAADFIATLPQPEPQDDVAALSARDFEMGETAVDPTQDGFAADQGDIGAVQGTDLIDPAAPEGEIWPEDEASPEGEIWPEVETPAEIAPPSEDKTSLDRGAETDLMPDQAMDKAPIGNQIEADPLPALAEPDEVSPPEPIDFEQTDAVLAEPEIAASSDPVIPDAAPDATPVQPDLFAPTPSFDTVMADEAPMALDVPIDETVVEDPAPMAGPSAGPSAGKAQTLLAEFAARREAALGKADTLGRVEPVLSAPKMAISVAPPLTADVRPETAAKNAAVAPHNPKRAKETSLGSKPAVKRPAPQARGSRSAVMGFVLTILLLIALAAAAALSSYLTTAWNSYGAATAVATVQPSIADEVAADLPEVASRAPQTADLAVPNTLPDPVSLSAPSLVLDKPSSLVPLATPAALPQPIVVAPPNITTASAEIAPEAPLITPTAQGVMTPEGVFLIAGRPSTLPLARPATVVTAALQRPAVAEIAPSDVTAPDVTAPDVTAPDVAPPFADPALAGKRPVIRPDALAPTVAVPSDPALAGKRPLTRPETVLAAGNAAQIALASLAQQGMDAPRSAMAVSISRLPVPRPRGLKTTIEAPQQLALATPEQVTPETVAPETPAALEADNEPEVVATKSSGPRTVVSKNATYKNAINLSKVNLIGVYGSQANRYALIRQANGRFKKVYVGDRFDGGLVAAITESELRYSKGGQMLALQMPKG